jgi:hypothetical protein
MILNGDKLEEASRIIEALNVVIHADTYLLAGGAPRDILNSKEISDFDYFTNTKLPPEKLVYYLSRDHGVLSTTTPVIRKSTYLNNKTVSVAIFGKICKHEIVFLDTDPITHIRTLFDINLCKVWFDPNRKEFCYDKSYTQDLENKTLTIDLRNFNEDQHEYAMGRCLLSHVPRILKKYPDFKLNVIGVTGNDNKYR